MRFQEVTASTLLCLPLRSQKYGYCFEILHAFLYVFIEHGFQLLDAYKFVDFIVSYFWK